MIKTFAKILEFTWLFVSVAGIIISIDSAIHQGIVSSLKYIGLTIIAILMYFWRRRQNRIRHK
jgi:hypothetical protein